MSVEAAQDPMGTLFVIAVIVGGFGLAVAVGVGSYRAHEVREKFADGLVVVKTCKPPVFRRAREYVARDATGQLWYFSRGGKVKTDAASVSEVCR